MHEYRKNADFRGQLHTFRNHALLQAVPFHQQFLVALLSPVVIFLLDIDDCAMNTRDALHDNVRQIALQIAYSVKLLVAFDIDAQSVFAREYNDRLKEPVERRRPEVKFANVPPV